MLFNSFHFLIFFAVVTTAYFVLPHRYRWFLLLASSCYFYMAFVPIYILILAFTIVIDYFAGYLVGTNRKEGAMAAPGDESDREHRRPCHLQVLQFSE